VLLGERGSGVRARRGLYKEDLAKVWARVHNLGLLFFASHFLFLWVLYLVTRSEQGHLHISRREKQLGAREGRAVQGLYKDDPACVQMAVYVVCSIRCEQPSSCRCSRWQAVGYAVAMYVSTHCMLLSWRHSLLLRLGPSLHLSASHTVVVSGSNSNIR
jgi:hypothetical protein